MKLEVHNKLNNPQTIDATRIVIYDQNDNPICVALEHIPNVIFIATAEHKDFNQILKNFNIHKTVICNTEEAPQLTL